MTVMEYVAKFTELALFADDYVATDMAKVRRFENGLKLSIRGKFVGLRLQDMDSLVGIVLAIERERWKTHGAFGMRVLVGRGRQRTFIPREPHIQDYPGPMTCFFGHQLGHMKRECPWRHGSQGFRPEQSQLSVGHARTQFVPSHPDMGQRKHFPSQGAMQAPSAAQTS